MPQQKIERPDTAQETDADDAHTHHHVGSAALAAADAAQEEIDRIDEALDANEAAMSNLLDEIEVIFTEISPDEVVKNFRQRNGQ